MRCIRVRFLHKPAESDPDGSPARFRVSCKISSSDPPSMIEPTSGSGAKAIARETPSAFDTPDPVPGAAARPVLALSDAAGVTSGGGVGSNVLCTKPAQTFADAGVAQTGRATRGDGPPRVFSGWCAAYGSDSCINRGIWIRAAC